MASCRLANSRSGRAFCSGSSLATMSAKVASLCWACISNCLTKSWLVGGYVSKSAQHTMKATRMNFQKSLFFMDGLGLGGAAGFENFRHRRFGDFHFGIRRSQGDGLVLYRDDLADDA